MSDFKILVDLSDRAYEVLSKLSGVLSVASTSNVNSLTPKKKDEPKKEEPKAVSELVESVSEDAVSDVDYEKLRAEIRALASAKKVAGKDVKAVLKKYGGKLNEVADTSLTALKEEMEVL